jgi:hypothetical protein
VFLVQILAVMAHTKFVHFMLDVLETSQAGPLLHHRQHVPIFQLCSHVVPVLHQLPKADVLRQGKNYVVAEIGIQRLHSRPVELNQRGLSEEVRPGQLLLVDQFRLDVHGLLELQPEHYIATRPFSGDYLGHRFCYLFFLETGDEVFKALQIFRVSFMSSPIDDIPRICHLFTTQLLQLYALLQLWHHLSQHGILLLLFFH